MQWVWFATVAVCVYLLVAQRSEIQRLEGELMLLQSTNLRLLRMVEWVVRPRIRRSKTF